MADESRVARNVSFLAVVLFSTASFAATLDFGRVRIGESQVDTVSIEHTNLIDLMVTERTLSNPVFRFASDPFSGDVSRILPGGMVRFPIVFAPQTLGEVSGQLKIRTDQSEFSWELKGSGAAEVIVFNEVLADPPPGLTGDANGDGVRSSNEDEFVELLNTGNYWVDIGGWELFDEGASVTNRFAFPAKTQMAPGERIVVFGGGSPHNISGSVFVDDGKMGGGLRNSGDKIYLFNVSDNDTVASTVYGSEGGRNSSLVRTPEGTGGWELHRESSSIGAPFSPGVASNQPDEAPRLIGLDVAVQDSVILVGEVVVLVVSGIEAEGKQTPLFEVYSTTQSDTTVLKYVEGQFVAHGVGQSEIVVRAGELTATVVVRVVAKGDLNFDGVYSLWDVIRTVHLILGITTAENAIERRSADLNGDLVLDIRDLMGLIQRMIGGPLVANKALVPDGVFGWEGVEGGVLLSVPPQTRVISFEIEDNFFRHLPKTESGEIFTKSVGNNLSGILILNWDMDISTTRVEILGVSPTKESRWVAWSTKGNPYRLHSLHSMMKQVRLLNIFPNPLNPSTLIRYTLQTPQDIVLTVYNVTGQRVRELHRAHALPGTHTMVWDTKDDFGRSVGSGLYFTNLQGDVNQSTLKMIVLR